MDAQVKTTDSVFVRNSRAINFVVNKINVSAADRRWIKEGQSENSVTILLSGYSFVSLRHETMASITDSIS